MSSKPQLAFNQPEFGFYAQFGTYNGPRQVVSYTYENDIHLQRDEKEHWKVVSLRPIKFASFRVPDKLKGNFVDKLDELFRSIMAESAAPSTSLPKSLIKIIFDYSFDEEAVDECFLPFEAEVSALLPNDIDKEMSTFWRESSKLGLIPTPAGKNLIAKYGRFAKNLDLDAEQPFRDCLKRFFGFISNVESLSICLECFTIPRTSLYEYGVSSLRNFKKLKHLDLKLINCVDNKNLTSTAVSLLEMLQDLETLRLRRDYAYNPDNTDTLLRTVGKLKRLSTLTICVNEKSDLSYLPQSQFQKLIVDHSSTLSDEQRKIIESCAHLKVTFLTASGSAQTTDDYKVGDVSTVADSLKSLTLI